VRDEDLVVVSVVMSLGAHVCVCARACQACDEVILGNIPIPSEDEVAVLVAQAMAMDLMEEFPDSVTRHGPGVVAEGD
jgi:hypothetical protein